MPNIYTAGYASRKWTPEKMVAVAKSHHAIWVDVRLRPYSRNYPAFNQKNLQAILGKSYVHMPAFGNVLHKEGGIQLSNSVLGLEQVKSILNAGYSIILMCACSKEHTCHRRVVKELIVRECNSAQVGDLVPAPDKREVVQLSLF